jgi:hypothetical protein
MASERKVEIADTPNIDDVLEFDSVLTISSDDNGEIQGSVEFEGEEYFEEAKSVEDLDDDELIWDGGPTAGMIKQWKQEFGDVYVTSITFDKHIVWRVLTRLEYKQIVKKMEQLIQAGTLSSAEANMWNEEAIAELCVLYPRMDRNAVSGAMAGLPSLISQEVLEASGFVALEVRQL